MQSSNISNTQKRPASPQNLPPATRMRAAGPTPALVQPHYADFLNWPHETLDLRAYPALADVEVGGPKVKVVQVLDGVNVRFRRPPPHNPAAPDALDPRREKIRVEIYDRNQTYNMIGTTSASGQIYLTGTDEQKRVNLNFTPRKSEPGSDPVVCRHLASWYALSHLPAGNLVKNPNEKITQLLDMYVGNVQTLQHTLDGFDDGRIVDTTAWCSSYAVDYRFFGRFLAVTALCLAPGEAAHATVSTENHAMGVSITHKSDGGYSVTLYDPNLTTVHARGRFNTIAELVDCQLQNFAVVNLNNYFPGGSNCLSVKMPASEEYSLAEKAYFLGQNSLFIPKTIGPILKATRFEAGHLGVFGAVRTIVNGTADPIKAFVQEGYTLMTSLCASGRPQLVDWLAQTLRQLHANGRLDDAQLKSAFTVSPRVLSSPSAWAVKQQYLSALGLSDLSSDAKAELLSIACPAPAAAQSNGP